MMECSKFITQKMIESISNGSAKTDTPIFSAKRLEGGCMLLRPQRFQLQQNDPLETKGI